MSLATLISRFVYAVHVETLHQLTYSHPESRSAASIFMHNLGIIIPHPFNLHTHTPFHLECLFFSLPYSWNLGGPPSA
jgi:hypothetical protein